MYRRGVGVEEKLSDTATVMSLESSIIHNLRRAPLSGEVYRLALPAITVGIVLDSGRNEKLLLLYKIKSYIAWHDR